jgi:hypothetical protein
VHKVSSDMNQSDSRDRESDSSWNVALKILRYLEQRPDAADTVEGIVEWWVPKQSIYEEAKVVQRALDDMVNREWLLTNESSDARKHYRLNTDRIEEIRSIIRKAEDE